MEQIKLFTHKKKKSHLQLNFKVYNMREHLGSELNTTMAWLSPQHFLSISQSTNLRWHHSFGKLVQGLNLDCHKSHQEQSQFITLVVKKCTSQHTEQQVNITNNSWMRFYHSHLFIFHRTQWITIRMWLEIVID